MTLAANRTRQRAGDSKTARRFRSDGSTGDIRMHAKQMEVYTQRPPISKAITTKARRLTVHLVTAQFAMVQGDHGTYIIDLPTLTCDCPAVGPCSHVCAAIAARADAPVLFHADRDAAGATGQYVYQTGLYIWTLDPIPATVPSWVDYSAELRSLAVFEDGEPIARCRDYRHGERIMQGRAAA